jgi:hypothetical protein
MSLVKILHKSQRRNRSPNMSIPEISDIAPKKRLIMVYYNPIHINVVESALNFAFFLLIYWHRSIRHDSEAELWRNTHISFAVK